MSGQGFQTTPATNASFTPSGRGCEWSGKKGGCIALIVSRGQSPGLQPASQWNRLNGGAIATLFPVSLHLSPGPKTPLNKLVLDDPDADSSMTV